MTAISLLVYPLGFCRYSANGALSAKRRRSCASHEPWFLTIQRDTKNTPQRGCLVYPLGLEPKLDGVGGRNVIQLHYGYVFCLREPKALPLAKEILLEFPPCIRRTYRSPVTLRVRIYLSSSILLFFVCFLQAFMLYYF